MIKPEHGGDIYNKKNIIDFSSNINPLGMPLSVKQSIINNIDNYEAYPDVLSSELITSISKHLNINKSNIVCGNGAADIIFRLCISLKPANALIVAPTFSEYEKALSLVNTKIKYYYLLDKNNFVLDENILDYINKDLKIIFVCNPNNPTGIPIKKDLMIKIAQKCKNTNTILVIDECFNDFLEDGYSLIDDMHNYKNIIILKSFTKMYAMAGIRLGYCICGESFLAKSISQTLQPWSVSTIASKCGIAALLETEYVAKTKKLMHVNRMFLMQNLKHLGFKVYNSMANYIFFKSDDNLLYEKLLKYNILIRCCSNYKGLDDFYYRVCVKSYKHNKYLINCLKIITKIKE